jgi:hypothetical protein
MKSNGMVRRARGDIECIRHGVCDRLVECTVTVIPTPIPNDSSDRHDILHMSAQAKMQSADLLFQISMFRKQDT